MNQNNDRVGGGADIQYVSLLKITQQKQTMRCKVSRTIKHNHDPNKT